MVNVNILIGCEGSLSGFAPAAQRGSRYSFAASGQSEKNVRARCKRAIIDEQMANEGWDDGKRRAAARRRAKPATMT